MFCSQKLGLKRHQAVKRFIIRNPVLNPYKICLCSTTAEMLTRNDRIAFVKPCFQIWIFTYNNPALYLSVPVEITNKMQPCVRIYYSTVHWRLNMFRAAYRSASGPLTVFAACGLHTHVVTGRSQVWVPLLFRAAYRSSSGALTAFAASGLHTHVVTGRSQFWVPLRLDYGRSPHAYINQRLQIQLELLMMSGMALETCWSFQWTVE